MPGSGSAFIPTINAITTSQDLQWMVQPTVITSMSNPYTRSHPYGLPVSSSPAIIEHTTLSRPGVIRSIGDARIRRRRDEQETEKLEEQKADLQKEIETLQKEKDKLEFMLVAHNPICKLPPNNHHGNQLQCTPMSLITHSPISERCHINHFNCIVVKQEPLENDEENDNDGEVIKLQASVIKPISMIGGGGGSGVFCPDVESLNTPVVAVSTPASTSGAPNLVFTYPNMLEPESPSPPSESCSKAHRRSSSSGGDQSSDSLHSPTLLAL